MKFKTNSIAMRFIPVEAVSSLGQKVVEELKSSDKEGLYFWSNIVMSNDAFIIK